MTNSTPRFSRVTIVVLMATGEQRYSSSAPSSLKAIGRAFREALESGPVRGAVVVTQEGISKYTANEVAELAAHPRYR